jgi:hypothetical protein
MVEHLCLMHADLGWHVTTSWYCEVTVTGGMLRPVASGHGVMVVNALVQSSQAAAAARAVPGASRTVAASATSKLDNLILKGGEGQRGGKKETNE